MLTPEQITAFKQALVDIYNDIYHDGRAVYDLKYEAGFCKDASRAIRASLETYDKTGDIHAAFGVAYTTYTGDCSCAPCREIKNKTLRTLAEKYARLNFTPST